jgi:hypothetical protein
MHYVRFLRPPSFTGDGRRKELKIIFIICTDLGDSLLSVAEPLSLTVGLIKAGSPDSSIPDLRAKFTWNPGTRVIKGSIPVPDAPWAQVVVAVPETLSATRFDQLAVVPSKTGATPQNPLIVPAWFDFRTGNRPAGVTDVCLRKLRVTDGVFIEFEEEFGDSIARHVWDGGLAAVSYLARVFQDDGNAASRMPRLRGMIYGDDSRSLNVLELGCGVGVLGLGLAALLSASMSADDATKSCLVMTDVPEAEERAHANIRLFQDSQARLGRTIPPITYENLDWEKGRQGIFSGCVGSTTWDLVILSDCTYNIDTIPALVETLSQLSVMTTTTRPPRQSALQVFLATKQRHSSEEAALEILHAHGWIVRESCRVELHGLPDESEEVQMYLLAME